MPPVTKTRLLGCVSIILCLPAFGCGGGTDTSDKPSRTDETEERAEPEDNYTCELSCVKEHGPTDSECYAESTACMSACIDLDDTVCLEACHDAEIPCTRSLRFCGSGCPCFQGKAQCALDCLNGGGDVACFDSCKEDYITCAVPSAPYGCTFDCDNTHFDCTQACEASATTLNDLTSCRTTCDNDYASCQLACTTI